jgi:integrase
LDTSPALWRSTVVLTATEVRTLLLHMQGTTGLIAQLLYGTGMRLLEALRLRQTGIVH